MTTTLLSSRTVMLHLAFSRMQPLLTTKPEYANFIRALQADDMYLGFLRSLAITREAGSLAELRAAMADPTVEIVLVRQESGLRLEDLERACAHQALPKTIVLSANEAAPC